MINCEVKLGENVVHLAKYYQNVLVNSATRRWVKINDDTLNVLKLYNQRKIEECESALKKLNVSEDDFKKMLEQLIDLEIMRKIDEPPQEPYEADDEIALEYVNFHVTNRCNLQCPMCCVCAGPNSELGMPLEKIGMAFNKLANAGCKRILITGGEPLIREDIFDILALANNNFERVSLITNGTLIDKEKAKKLRLLTNDVTVSLDGATAEIHEITRGKGTFTITTQGIRTLAETGVRIMIAGSMTEHNIHESPDKMRELMTSLGAENLYRCRFIPAGRGKNNRAVLNYYRSLISTYTGRFKMRCEAQEAELAESRDAFEINVGTDSRRCAALVRRIAIDAHGAMYPCVFMQEPKFYLGHIFDEGDIIEILMKKDITQQILKRTVDNLEVCKDCPIRYFCSGECMASAYHEHGSIFARDPYCILTRIRVAAKLWSFQGGRTKLENMQLYNKYLEAEKEEALKEIESIRDF